MKYAFLLVFLLAGCAENKLVSGKINSVAITHNGCIGSAQIGTDVIDFSCEIDSDGDVSALNITTVNRNFNIDQQYIADLVQEINKYE